MAVPMLEVLEQKFMSMAENNRLLREEVVFLKQQVDDLRHKHQCASDKINTILSQLESLQEKA